MIRLAVAGDSINIATILKNAWQKAFIGIIDENYPKQIDLNRYETIFSNNINNKLEDIYVYESERGIIEGFISGKINKEDRTAEIIGLYINPESQGKSVGTLLINYMHEYYKKANIRKLNIRTLRNAKNKQFYEKHNYQVEKVIELEIGDRKYEGIIYSKLI